jgi:hypothetical protein
MIPIVSGIIPCYVLLRIADALLPHFPQGIHTLGGVGVALGFCVFAIALGILWSAGIGRFYKMLDNRKEQQK